MLSSMTLVSLPRLHDRFFTSINAAEMNDKLFFSQISTIGWESSPPTSVLRNDFNPTSIMTFRIAGISYQERCNPADLINWMFGDSLCYMLNYSRRCFEDFSLDTAKVHLLQSLYFGVCGSKTSHWVMISPF